MQRLITFNAQDVLELLKHYTAFGSDPIPIDATLREFLVGSILDRFIGLWVEGSWEDPERKGPLYVRYEGRKVLTWSSKSGSQPTFQPEEETKFE